MTRYRKKLFEKIAKNSTSNNYSKKQWSSEYINALLDLNRIPDIPSSEKTLPLVIGYFVVLVEFKLFHFIMNHSEYLKEFFYDY